MASQGPLYPGTVTTEVGPAGDNNWTSAANVGADDGSNASITAATFDAGDDSFRLKAQNFGFTIPAGSTIDGIIVEIERSNAAGAASDGEVRLYDSTATLVGDDKRVLDVDWPTGMTLATYGGAADTWTAGLDVTDINSTNFGVAFIVFADAANTDIAADFIRVTVHYTPPAPTGTVDATDSDDTSSSSGTVTVTGSAAPTEADDTSSASGLVTVTGTAAVTEADDTSSASGTVESGGITGSIAATDGDDTSSATGTVLVTGTAAPVEVDDTSSASGLVTVTGTAAVMEADDTSSASGEVTGGPPLSGTIAATEAGDIASASGVVGVEEQALAPRPEYTSLSHWEPGRQLVLPKGKKKKKLAELVSVAVADAARAQAELDLRRRRALLALLLVA